MIHCVNCCRMHIYLGRLTPPLNNNWEGAGTELKANLRCDVKIVKLARVRIRAEGVLVRGFGSKLPSGVFIEVVNPARTESSSASHPICRRDREGGLTLSLFARTGISEVLGRYLGEPRNGDEGILPRGAEKAQRLTFSFRERQIISTTMAYTSMSISSGILTALPKR